MTQSPTPIHEAVREHYAERIKKSASCCATESACTPESELYPVDLLTTVPSDVGATTYGWRLTRRYAASGAAKFGDVAGAAERGLVWIGHWRGAVSGVVCQCCIVGGVHSSLVPRKKDLRTPKKCGLRTEIKGWLG